MSIEYVHHPLRPVLIMASSYPVCLRPPRVAVNRINLASYHIFLEKIDAVDNSATQRQS